MAKPYFYAVRTHEGGLTWDYAPDGVEHHPVLYTTRTLREIEEWIKREELVARERGDESKREKTQSGLFE